MSARTIWFTGLSSAGKSTLSQLLHDHLRAAGHKVELLDGDTIRRHLSKGLGFTREDREENLRRIAFVAELLARNGVTVIVAAIAPYHSIREEVRARLLPFVEIYVNAPLAICEQRDVKGLYRKTREGHMTGMTGIDDPYEPPLSPEIECRTDLETIEQSLEKILGYLHAQPPNS
ncbi:MAG: adenylyl-sulfate kinase [Acidobacteria bacterium]|nr:adenylyl-sulfate kinase [Acidobacteriota bacterium]